MCLAYRGLDDLPQSLTTQNCVYHLQFLALPPNQNPKKRKSPVTYLPQFLMDDMNLDPLDKPVTTNPPFLHLIDLNCLPILFVVDVFPPLFVLIHSIEHRPISFDRLVLF